MTQPAIAQDANAPAFKGPFAPLASNLADKGITLHATTYDFLNANPSFGLEPGHASNSTYWVTGMDLDLDKLAGLRGATIHLKETFFSFVYNNDDIAAEFGDNSLGYQTTYNMLSNQLSELTYEQKLLNGRLDIEFGRTHPNFYFTPMTCQTYNTCYQDILYFDAGYISPLHSTWGGRVKYNLTPSSYIEAGTFANDEDWHNRTGWDWALPLPPGTLNLAEYGFDTDPGGKYPGHYAITGYYNSGEHDDSYWTANHQPRGYFPDDPSEIVDGTSGAVLNTQQLIWREDGGSNAQPSPRTLTFYSGAGLSFDTTQPIQSDLYAGLTLQAPLLSRPHDQVGIKVRWEHMTDDYARFLAQANAYAGGSGQAFAQDKAIFELNANISLGAGIVLEPVVQYIVNPNSYYNPYTADRPKEGFFVGGTLMVPLGAIAGLEAQ